MDQGPRLHKQLKNRAPRKAHFYQEAIGYFRLAYEQF